MIGASRAYLCNLREHSRSRIDLCSGRTTNKANQVRADGPYFASPQPHEACDDGGMAIADFAGTLFLGIGAGAYPLATYMHGIKVPNDGSGTGFLNEMVRESLYIMEKIWKREPFFYEGRFWDAGFPEEAPAETEEDEQHKLANYSPWNGAFPEIAVTGFSANSPSMKLAGERNFKPISIYSGLEALKRHWEIYSEAAIKAGHKPDRSRHAVSQTVFVADTDKEAKEAGYGRADRLLLSIAT